jgi:hypothetical protein
MGRRPEDHNTSPLLRHIVPCDIFVVIVCHVMILPVFIQCVMIVVTVALPHMKLYRLTGTFDDRVNSRTIESGIFRSGGLW